MGEDSVRNGQIERREIEVKTISKKTGSAREIKPKSVIIEARNRLCANGKDLTLKDFLVEEKELARRDESLGTVYREEQ